MLKTLGVIGGGIVGRSLLYNLSLLNNKFDKILIFNSEEFAIPCALRTTAIVAPRGVTRGLSPLGDLILEGVEDVKNHVINDSPDGVFPISQFTGAYTKLEAFQKRYPNGEEKFNLDILPLKKKIYFIRENAFMFDPALYLAWLMKKASEILPVQEINHFVTGIDYGDKIMLRSQNDEKYEVDCLVLATGSYSRYWKNLFPQTPLEKSRPVQGSYLEFNGVDLNLPSLSITLEGCNLVYHSHCQRLLIGSTTDELVHALAPMDNLKFIYRTLSENLDIKLPAMDQGKILIGHREKAFKRRPYLFNGKNIFCIGGFYKNGFSLSLKMTRTLSHQLLESV